MSYKVFNQVFQNTQNSYKFYWWLAIIEICFQQEKKNIYFDEIVLKVISKLWYPVNYFKLSFGNNDQCEKLVKKIQQNYKLEDNINENDLYEFLIRNKDSGFLVKIRNELTRYVPFRFIRPWYIEETRGLKDSLVNSKIIEFQDNCAPYKINLDSKKIVISEEWFRWIKNNYTLIKSFTYFELIKYLEGENPNVANLSKKLSKPIVRNLTLPTKYWKHFALKHPTQIDVFENKPLIKLEEFSLDHFFPWSFLAHDLIWNLHPMNKIVNSSKNNFLPQKIHFSKFHLLQYNFCNFLLNEDLRKPLENYYTLFNCSREELISLSQDQFIIKMDNYYLPQYEIAKNMGFACNWSLNQF